MGWLLKLNHLLFGIRVAVVLSLVRAAFPLRGRPIKRLFLQGCLSKLRAGVLRKFDRPMMRVVVCSLFRAGFVHARVEGRFCAHSRAWGTRGDLLWRGEILTIRDQRWRRDVITVSDRRWCRCFFVASSFVECSWKPRVGSSYFFLCFILVETSHELFIVAVSDAVMSVLWKSCGYLLSLMLEDVLDHWGYCFLVYSVCTIIEKLSIVGLVRKVAVFMFYHKKFNFIH